jgi:serine/threonine-protein kinase
MEELPQNRLAEFRRGKARYTPLTRIAAGGMGEVWRGEARFPDGHVQAVAIKRLLPYLAGNARYRRMLEDEARLGMMLDHPNIVRVLDARPQGSFILIMEFVEGCALRQVLDRLRSHDQSVPVAAALHIGHSVARALTHAHEALDDQGRDLAVIHSDVSPHNVLLGVDGSVKLMDFGLARAAANLTDRPAHRITGKYGYLAPEVVLRRELGQPADLFALGVVLWECVTGKRLFAAHSLRDSHRLLRTFHIPKASLLNPAVSKAVEALLRGMLKRTPEERISSSRALVHAFEAVIEAMPNYRGEETTAQLVSRNLRESRRTLPPPQVTYLSEAELEEFFATEPTTIFTPNLPPAAPHELDVLFSESDSGLFAR